MADPDARPTATESANRGARGYNGQAVVDISHHILVGNVVTNRGHDRSNLLVVTKAAQTKTSAAEVSALAERYYCERKQILTARKPVSSHGAQPDHRTGSGLRLLGQARACLSA